MFKMVGTMMPQTGLLQFNRIAEIVVISLALLVFASLHFNPHLAENALSNWFYLSILDIEDTVFFGFIFKIIGFFFLLNMLAKMFNGIAFIINGGKPSRNVDDVFNQDVEQKNDGLDNFDDYEEIN